MLKSSLCNYNDAYKLVSGTSLQEDDQTKKQNRQMKEGKKGGIFENCALFTGCINGINNTQVDHAKDLDAVMPMYNLIEFSNIFQKHDNYDQFMAMLQR